MQRKECSPGRPDAHRGSMILLLAAAEAPGSSPVLSETQNDFQQPHVCALDVVSIPPELAS